MDGSGFRIETPAETVEHDLTTPRGRLLYLRDTIVPRIDRRTLDMNMWECGTHACLGGQACRDPLLRDLGLPRDLNQTANGHDHLSEFFGLSLSQDMHLFASHAYGHGNSTPTHAELTAHINDVLTGRVK